VDTSMRVSNAKAKAELGWSPKYPASRDGVAAID
jgi:nucleoside-diphosphate-sugar epimerase